MRNLTRLLVVACGYAVLAPVAAAAQVPPPPTPRPLESVTINFTAGSARLSNIAKAKLDEVALVMKQEPDARAQVIGYAGANEGSTGAQQLADNRASAVKNYLVTRHGIDPARIATSSSVSSDGVCPEGGRCAVLTVLVPQ